MIQIKDYEASLHHLVNRYGCNGIPELSARDQNIDHNLLHHDI